MKKVNFLHTLSPRQHDALMQWYRISFLLFITVIVCILIVEMRQVKKYYLSQEAYRQLQIKNKRSEEVVFKEGELKKKRHQLYQEMMVARSAEQSLRMVHGLLESIVQTVPSESIENIDISSDTIRMQFILPNTEEVVRLMHLLAQEPLFRHPSLKSVTTRTDGKIACTLLCNRRNPQVDTQLNKT